VRRSPVHVSAVLMAAMALACLASPAAYAAPANGEFTRAEANADWTLGSVAGSAAWSGCQFESEPPWYELKYPWYEPSRETWSVREECRLQAFATIGPGSGQSDCSVQERHWPHSGDQLALAWTSDETRGSGSASFDVSAVPLSGAPGELACLSLLETYLERPACQVHPEPGVVCAQFILVVDNYSVLASAMLAAPPPSPPVNAEAPQLTGTPKVGETLACSNGSWTNAPTSFAYSWLRDGDPISGQTTNEYTVQSVDSGHQLSCEVTATNAGGSPSAVSDPLSIPPPPPVIENESLSHLTPTDAILEADFDLHEAATGVYYQFQLVDNPDEYASEILCPPTLQPGYSGCIGPQGPGALPIGFLPGNTMQSSATSHASLDLASAGVALQPATAYHYRVLAAQAKPSEDTIEWLAPTSFGADQAFETPEVSSSGSDPEVGDPHTTAPSPVVSQPPSVTPPRQRRHRRHRHHRRSRQRTQLQRASAAR